MSDDQVQGTLHMVDGTDVVYVMHDKGIDVNFGKGLIEIRKDTKWEAITELHEIAAEQNKLIIKSVPLTKIVTNYKNIGVLPGMKMNAYGMLALMNRDSPSYFDSVKKVTNLAFTKVPTYTYRDKITGKTRKVSDYFKAKELETRGYDLTLVGNSRRPYKESLIKSYIIPKANGKKRIVREATGHLGLIHEHISDILNMVYEKEIPTNMFAYRKGISVNHLATLLHENMEPKDSILKLDIRNWFDTITEKEIYEHIFKPFVVPHHNKSDSLVDFAKAMSEICTYRGRAAQGFKCTPIISLLICKYTWGRVVNEFFKKYELTGGIYCDNIFAVIPHAKHKEAYAWLKELRDAIEAFSGRRCHKAAVVPWYKRQRVLGLIINKQGAIKHSRATMEKREMCKRITYNLEHRGAKRVIKDWFLKYQGQHSWPIPDGPRYVKYRDKIKLTSKESLVKLIDDGNIHAWVYAKTRFRQWFSGQLNWVGMTMEVEAEGLKQRYQAVFTP